MMTNMQTSKQNSKGFSLVEMLLVLVIMSGVIYIGAGYMQQRTLSLRIDRTSAQMQQILNAGMSYYISNSAWPANLAALQPAYLPSSVVSPWDGSAYSVYSSNSNLYVSVKMPTLTATSISIAKTIAGSLPLSFTAKTANATSNTACVTGSPCYVVATVNIPSQKLSDTRAVNFAGLYHNGACVIAPNCPTNYQAQAFAVPVSVNGFYNAPDPASPTATCNPTDKSGCIMTYVPLNGFTAYTTSDTPVVYSNVDTTKQPISCGSGVTATSPCDENVDSSGNKTTMSSGISVWRVCISATTSSGEVKPSGSFANPWGQLTGTVMVMTRCVPTSPTEDTGSQFTVWQPSS